LLAGVLAAAIFLQLRFDPILEPVILPPVRDPGRYKARQRSVKFFLSLLVWISPDWPPQPDAKAGS
jgi:hypothetical protein